MPRRSSPSPDITGKRQLKLAGQTENQKGRKSEEYEVAKEDNLKNQNKIATPTSQHRRSPLSAAGDEEETEEREKGGDEF